MKNYASTHKYAHYNTNTHTHKHLYHSQLRLGGQQTVAFVALLYALQLVGSIRLGENILLPCQTIYTNVCMRSLCLRIRVVAHACFSRVLHIVCIYTDTRIYLFYMRYSTPASVSMRSQYTVYFFAVRATCCCWCVWWCVVHTKRGCSRSVLICLVRICEGYIMMGEHV